MASDTCEISDEYNQARKEVYRMVNGDNKPYQECKNSMHTAYHWKAVSACVAEGKGKNIGGGCSHLVGHGGYPREKVDVSHCEILKVEKPENAKDLFLKYLKEYVEQNDIVKCKHNKVLKKDADNKSSAS